jgi:predicted  nucleic acid-binding Zn-ribbon protein
MGGGTVSDTPRTDDQIGYDGSTMSAIRIEFCRQLERELNAANVEIEEKRKDVVYLATEKAKLEERIKRLEEVGNELRECARQLGWTSSDDSRWIERADAIVEAWDKEVKP